MHGNSYYNENDSYAAQWLRNLIAAGHIAPGDVDERSIVDVRPSDLGGYVQCHFFAGIGGWSHSLRRAGWADDRPVWTGSCPCQPFSAAGKGGGLDDERHLWPAFYHLIEKCSPSVVIGEQVASKDGLAWLDLVQADMEGSGYAFGALDLCAAGFGAPHIRQRLYWLADSAQQLDNRAGIGRTGRGLEHPDGGTTDGGDASAEGLQRGGQHGFIAEDGSAGTLADASNRQLPQPGRGSQERNGHGSDCPNTATGPTNGRWGNVDWLLCRDGKWRPVEPGTFPLAHGAPGRVGRLRAYGNAIVATQAQEFIAAYLEARD